MKAQNIFIGIVAVIVLALGVTFPHSQTVIQQVAKDTKSAVVGAFAGPDIYSEYLTFNGTEFHYASVPMRTATTTVCSIKTPNSTSTITSGMVLFRTSSTSASTITIAKGVTPNASTTVIKTQAVAAGAQATVLVASSTMSAAAQVTNTFAPSTYVNVLMRKGIGTFSPTGRCDVVFQTVR